MNKIYLFKFALITISFSLVSSGCDGVASRTYYVSIKGNDMADGKSPSTAWKTISKVNSKKFAPGDSILFEAGGIWRETLKVMPGSAITGKVIYYGRYGHGNNNPKILGSQRVNSWDETEINNIWRAEGFFEDLRKYYGAELYFLKNDSVIWGDYQDYNPYFSNVKKEFDWTWDNRTIFIFSTTDPDLLYQSVEVPQREGCIIAQSEASSNIEINGIDFFFSKRFGYFSGYPETAKQSNLTFKNCNIGYIGLKGASSAYGIAAFHSNMLVEKCTITDCGRRSISVNLYTKKPIGKEVKLDSIIIRNCLFKRGYHTTSLDLAMTKNCIGDTIQNIYFYNNIIDDHEILMTDEDKLSNQIFTQAGGGYINNVFIYNNIFINSTGRNILIEGGDSIFIWNNTIVGHNKNIKKSPFSNVSLNYPLAVDYRNNLLFDNLGNNSLNSHGVMMYYTPGKFIDKDFNLYFSLYPGIERHFSTHRPNNNPNSGVGYWNINQWSKYKADNPAFEKHSPTPQDPCFNNPEDFDFSLRPESPARGVGTKINKIDKDIFGTPMNNPPDLGAIQTNTKGIK